MTAFPLKINNVTAKILVCFLENKEDIECISFLNLSENINAHIHLHLTKDSSSVHEFFLGDKKFEKLIVIISKESEYHKKVLFLGKYFPKFPDHLWLFATTLEQKKLLLEVCELSRYKFQLYKTKKQERKTEIFCTNTEKKDLQEMQNLLENIMLARDLGETPACDLTPEAFAQIIKKTKFQHIKVKILSYKEIQKKWLWFLNAVWKWSENKPCMVILEHIKNKKKPFMGIVGKWVTFDTGGNQIKPGDHMYEMKGDMGGAAVTFALMKELDRHNIDKNIVACLVLAENVVSNNSYKPSDILKWYNWKTVEVIHTDAEGRLVLADGISYLWKNYKTSSIMTLATLTGACVAALGYRYAGIMWTDEIMINSILQYNKDHTEQYVRLPFDDLFIEKTMSEIADFKNLDRSVQAGSSMWGAFLANFLENKEAFTHIDIAGTYINGWDAYGKCPKWMTGFWVESLSYILRK